MTQWLKQNTAFTFRMGPFVEISDGDTPVTDLAIAQGDIQISKNGGAFAQTSASTPTTTHDSDGWYQLPLTATDTGTLGPMTVKVRISGARVVWEKFMVVPANVYDSMVGGSDRLDVGEVESLAANSVTASALASDAASEIGTAVWATGVRTLTALDEDTTTMDLDATVRGALGLAAANLDTQLGAINEKTTNLPSDPADASVIASATGAILTAVGEVQTDVTEILDDTGTTGVVVAAASKTGYRLSGTGVDDILDEPVEGAVTLRQSVRLHNSVLGGKVSGMGTTAVEFRDLADTKNVLEATVDGDGNREAVTRDLT